MDSEKGKTKRVPLTEEEKRERKNQRQKEYSKKTGYAANIKYDKENVRQYILKIMKTTEQDIIDHLDAQPNKNGYIKRLIREDMDRTKK